MNTNLNKKTSSKQSMEKVSSESSNVVAVTTDEHGYKVEMPRELSLWSAIGLGLAIMVSELMFWNATKTTRHALMA